MKNIVEVLKQEVVSLAISMKFGCRFTQTNGSKFSCTSRIYLFPLGTDPVNCNSPEVLKMWSFGQRQDVGSTARCRRYQVLSEIYKYLKKEDV